MACDDWQFGRYCSPFCNEDWDFTSPLYVHALWVCDAKGKWVPPVPWPDCTGMCSNQLVPLILKIHVQSAETFHVMVDLVTKMRLAASWQLCTAHHQSQGSTKVVCHSPGIVDFHVGRVLILLGSAERIPVEKIDLFVAWTNSTHYTLTRAPMWFEYFTSRRSSSVVTSPFLLVL